MTTVPNQRPRPLRVLIANHQFWRYSGSEVHALQLAEHFLNDGAEVSFFHITSEPWLLEEAARKGIAIVSWRQLLARMNGYYDIVWTHHETQFFLLHCLYGIRCRLAVHGLLSYTVRLERFPLLPDASSAGPGGQIVFLANSTETRDAVSRASGWGDIGVLLNIVPDAFPDRPKESYAPSPGRIAVVSNHIGPEVVGAGELLEREGVTVEFFGEGHRYVLIDENTLTGFDVVVTIGKTAQYAIVQGIPLFVYDLFGGPGYMRPEEFGLHEDFNFSGRSAPERLGPEELKERIISGYPGAVKDARTLRERHGSRYRVSSQIAGVLDSASERPSAALGPWMRRSCALRTILYRPSVPVRLLFPRLIDRLGQWRNALRS